MGRNAKDRTFRKTKVKPFVDRLIEQGIPPDSMQFRQQVMRAKTLVGHDDKIDAFIRDVKREYSRRL